MRALMLIVVGLLAGALMALMATSILRPQGTYSKGVMAVMQHHFDGLRRNARTAQCPMVNTSYHVQRLRIMADEVSPAIIAARDPGPGFEHRLVGLQRALDAALSAPPPDCVALNTLIQELRDRCEACHLEYR